ncbi:hypothetical protein OIY81_1047 [Cryptosporidium canis]|uniref:Uncharacterized protein n=1 Tax=Cryptosporidium canis TaxID=195482 RepID=A0ABQ8PBI7_9CRYT|nr:hypothetical protein OIY81_1047 [Cryptosporidium canis]KAJ1615339.1 hypothetical protein OJ252_218 [Cryptosporidium canis]
MATLLNTGFALFLKELFDGNSMSTIKDKLIENIDIKSAQILNKSIRKRSISRLFNRLALFSLLLFSGGLGYYYYRMFYKKQAKRASTDRVYNFFSDIFSKLPKKNSSSSR